MSDSTTVARPYAKAIFEYAVEENNLAEWSSWLNALDIVVSNELTNEFIQNPASSEDQHVELLITVLEQGNKKIPESVKHLIQLLAHNGRIISLPDMKLIFDEFRSEYEKTMTVDVISYSELDTAQQSKLVESLSSRLKRKVELDIKTDSSILGGAIIKAGDMVIDGSVRGKIAKLQTNLTV